MSEKEIEQKFKADFRELFPKLKDATAVLAAIPPILFFAQDSVHV